MKGIYLVTEAGCLDPTTGAARHIHIGIRELEKYFSVELISPNRKSDYSDVDSVQPKPRSPEFLNLKDNKLTGSLRDLKYFLRNCINAISVLKLVNTKKPDFVYIRAHFLDPLPLFLYALGIPFFIEANGLQFESRQKYYKSLLTPAIKWFERFTYSIASYVFFIGSYGDFWQLKKNNWCNIENGVESDFISYFSDHSKKVEETIDIVLIARLMAHHQPQTLISAIRSLHPDIRKKLCLHLIGSGLSIIKDELQEYTEVIEHGFLEHNELSSHLKQIHVGLIPGVPKYQSQMKLFDYGAAKCISIVPKVHNLQYWFDESEVEFFESNNADSLAQTIENVLTNTSFFLRKGERLHQRIKADFTWEIIFAQKANIIKSMLSIK